MRTLPIALALALLAGPALAQSRITEADVRAFLARQEQAWNAGGHDRFFAAFTPDAQFTDQAYVGDKPPVPYGTSTLAEARAQAGKARAAGKSSRETGQIRRIVIAPDGRTAQVVTSVSSAVTAAGKSRRLCASRTQTLVLSGGALRSRGQTDTFVHCRGG